MTIRGLIVSSVFRRHLHVISRSKTIIKPASPTPLNLKQYNLPFYDCLAINHYFPILFLYPKNNSDHGSPQPRANTTTASISNRLKKSLSETLSKYYPFAGRLSSETHVDCSDQGVDFVEVQIGCKLSEIQGNTFVTGDKFSGHLFPPSSIWDEVPNQDSSFVRVQLNHLAIAIAASVSHKLSDALTVCGKCIAPLRESNIGDGYCEWRWYGIKAIVGLEEKDMENFLSNQELLTYASFL